MKVTKRELRRIIREEKVRLRRKDTSKTTSISGQAGKKSRANRLRRFNEAFGDETILAPHPEELSMAKDELLGILQSMDPMDRNAEIYALIDELETLAETGE